MVLVIDGADGDPAIVAQVGELQLRLREVLRGKPVLTGVSALLCEIDAITAETPGLSADIAPVLATLAQVLATRNEAPSGAVH